MPRKTLYKRENAVLSRLLREMRSATDLTQVDLADVVKQSQSFVSKVEAGERRMDLVQLREYCIACGVPLLTFVKRFEAAL